MRGGSVTRLVWNAVGARIFEAGVDQGVLYVDGSDGVPWNGLVSVSESPSGGDVSSYYVDGIKYLAVSAAEEFEATVEAYTYPDEFAVCEWNDCNQVRVVRHTATEEVFQPLLSNHDW
jgi:hypothetical protein